MDKDVALGSVGDVDFAFSGGKASVKLSLDSKVALEALRKAVDGKLPAEAPAIDTVFGWLEAALVTVT